MPAGISWVQGVEIDVENEEEHWGGPKYIQMQFKF